jgi:hypothetical protein
MPGRPAIWIRDGDDEPPRRSPPYANDPQPFSDDRDELEMIVLRCFPCAGSGKIIMFHSPGPAARTVRCPVCAGRGYVSVS